MECSILFNGPTHKNFQQELFIKFESIPWWKVIISSIIFLLFYYLRSMLSISYDIIHSSTNCQNYLFRFFEQIFLTYWTFQK